MPPPLYVAGPWVAPDPKTASGGGLIQVRVLGSVGPLPLVGRTWTGPANYGEDASNSRFSVANE